MRALLLFIIMVYSLAVAASKLDRQRSFKFNVPMPETVPRGGGQFPRFPSNGCDDGVTDPIEPNLRGGPRDRRVPGGGIPGNGGPGGGDPIEPNSPGGPHGGDVPGGGIPGDGGPGGGDPVGIDFVCTISCLDICQTDICIDQSVSVSCGLSGQVD